jgi:hypothetical protein
MEQIKETVPDLIIINDTITEKEESVLALIEEIKKSGINILFLNKIDSLLNISGIKYTDSEDYATLDKNIFNIPSTNILDKPRSNHQSIEVRGKQQQKIYIHFEQILWIDVERNYCFLKTEQDRYGLKISLSKLITLLDKRFLRIHRGCIVNSDYISSVQLSKQQLRVKNNVLMIGRLYKSELLNFLAERH